MEQERIRELLDKDYEGNTTEEEETLLKELLSDPSLPLSVRAESGHIAALATTVPEPSEGFAERLEAVTRNKSVRKLRPNRLRFLLSTAATIAILTGTYLLFDYLSGRDMNDTFKDPEIAMAEVRSILLSVSLKMNEATEPLGSMNAMTKVPDPLGGIGKINSMIGNNLSKLHYLDQVASSTKTIENN